MTAFSRLRTCLPTGGCGDAPALRPRLSLRLRSAAAWTCIGWAASRAGNIVAWLYAARVLGKAAYGQYATVQAAVGVFSLVGAIGFGTTAARYVSHLRGQDPERAGRIAGLLLAAAGLCGGLAAILLWRFADIVCSYPGVGLIRLSAPAVLMYSIDGVVTGILSGLESFRTIALVSMLQGAVITAATIILTPSFGLEGAVAALVVSATFATAMDGAVLYRQIQRRRAPFSLAGALRERRVLLQFSLPTTLNSVIVSGSYLATLSLLQSGTGGNASAGVFGLGRQIGMWIQVAPQILLRATLPVLSERLSSDRTAASGIVSVTHGLYMLSCFPLCAMVVCATQPLLSMVAPAFRDERLAITALIVANAFGVARGASELFLVAQGRAWTNVGLSATWNGFMLMGAWLAYRGEGTAVVSSATALGLLLAASLGNRLIRLPAEWSPWRTDLCMLTLIAVAGASLIADLARIFPLVGIVFAVACYQFLPASLRASLRERMRYQWSEAGAGGC